MASYLMIASAGIILALGTVHLLLTFFGSMLRPRDATVEAAMKASYPGLTTQTTMWKAWIGFNASHSLGAIAFGLIYGYLAIYESSVLFGSSFLSALGLPMLVAFALLGKFYWFADPLRGILAALACYAAAIGLVWL